MSILFPSENETIEEFAVLSARLRNAIGPHIVAILRAGLSVVLDFPANTVEWRLWICRWLRKLALPMSCTCSTFPTMNASATEKAQCERLAALGSNNRYRRPFP